MRNSRRDSMRLMLVGSWLGLVLLIAPSAMAQTEEPEWPREIRVAEGTITVYQPQLESFKDDKLTALAAVSVLMQGKTEPVFGAAWFSSRVLTDRDTRMVTLLDVDVPEVKFPHAKQEDLDKLSGVLKREFSKTVHVISLDRLLAALQLVEKEQAAAEALNNHPPKILFVKYPAVLVTLDGKPELRPVPNTKLMRVVNTPFLIVLDAETKAYYLKGGAEWYKAAEVMGPWETIGQPPAAVAAIVQDAPDAAKAGNPPAAPSAGRSRIIVATEPTELIASEGEPTYTPIAGTGLLYMSNTESDVLMEIASQKYFVLLAGRWFTAASMDGPWSFVASDKLPADFAKIPPDSEKGDLLANVAGTEEAVDAVQETYIPQTAQVDRKATVKVEYDGAPKFVQIEGTEMLYAANTAESVIQVQQSYYCCHEAVWYVASQPLGPWAVCVSVPQVIYTIPPSCPVYPVKYVYVYQSTPTTVYVGYTPGYVGCYPYCGAVVYGTGYVYAGWRGAIYYPPPTTFGFGVHYNSVTGNWGFHVGAAGPNGWVVGGYHEGKYYTGPWIAGGTWGNGIHGGWWGHGWNYPPQYRGNVNMNRDVNVNRNVNVGNVNIGNQVDVGNRANIYNRPTNVDRNVRPPQAANGPVQPPANRADAVPGQRPANNVFADRDGNVFRRTDEGGWQRHGDSGWTPQDRPVQSPQGGGVQRTPGTPANQAPTVRPTDISRQPDRSAGPSQTPTGVSRSSSSLDRDYQARQRGSQRTENFRQYQSFGGGRDMPTRSFQRGGGGMRGGRR